MALWFFSLVIENLNSFALAGVVIRSWRPQVASWRGTVFVRDCVYLPHSLFWILCTAAEGKIGSADWHLQKVSTKFWFLSIVTTELEFNHDIFYKLQDHVLCPISFLTSDTEEVWLSIVVCSECFVEKQYIFESAWVKTQFHMWKCRPLPGALLYYLPQTYAFCFEWIHSTKSCLII